MYEGSGITITVMYINNSVQTILEDHTLHVQNISSCRDRASIHFRSLNYCEERITFLLDNTFLYDMLQNFPDERKSTEFPFVISQLEFQIQCFSGNLNFI